MFESLGGDRHGRDPEEGARPPFEDPAEDRRVGTKQAENNDEQGVRKREKEKQRYEYEGPYGGEQGLEHDR